jgi:hypothetical protein
VVQAQVTTEVEPETSVVIGLTDGGVAPAVALAVGADAPGDVPVDDALEGWFQARRLVPRGSVVVGGE